MTKLGLSRRRFLGSAAGFAAGTLVLPRFASARSYAANDRVGLALIGVGGRGRWFVQCIPGLGEEFVALADVNEQRAAEGFERFPKTPKFRDYRKMLHDLDDQIDAVIVAAPDAIHAPSSALALQMGKHVYCEKPLTHRVSEARFLREEARRRKVATQMGNQGTASGEFRRALELIRAGVIGEVREVHVWNTNGGPGDRPLPVGSEPVPEHLAWDLWLGPAPLRPYHPGWMVWHGWREFGTGNLGNWACHSANLAFMALDVASLWQDDGKDPATIRVRAEASEVDAGSFPRWEVIRYEVPARGKRPPVTFQWSNGSGKAPRGRERYEEVIGHRLDWGDAGERKYRDHAGCLLVGSEGAIHATAHNATFSLHPKGKALKKDLPPPSVPRSPGHEREWLDACRGGTPAFSSFDYSGPLTEFVLLGNIATGLTEPITFDPVACRITDNEVADRALRREYRKGWELES